MAEKKPFFQEATKAEIKRKKLVEVERLADVEKLQDNEYAVFPSYVPRGFASARKFMKHGQEVKPKRYWSLEQAVKETKTPVQLREVAFDSIEGHYFCGYSFMPLGKDRRKRKVSLIECLEGARIYAYSHQVDNAKIKIKPYDDAKRVRIDGTEVVVEVPSRTAGERKFRFKLISVPVIDSIEKYVVSLNIGSDHSCSSKRFNIRYKYTDDKEGSGIVNVCGHEIAAYFELIDFYWNTRKNIIPLQMCQFAIPSQRTVNYYLKFENNVLIKDENLTSKDKLRKPNRADKEIALWSFVRAFKHDATFFSMAERDGNLRNYKWENN